MEQRELFCIICHIRPPRKSGRQCNYCAEQRSRANDIARYKARKLRNEKKRYRAKKDTINQAKRERYQADEVYRQAILTKQQVYAEQHRESEAARARQWRKDHPDELWQLNQNYYAVNKEQMSDYQKRYHEQNPWVRKSASKRRKARVRQAKMGVVTAQGLQDMVDYFQSHCAYCLVPLSTVTFDHMQPVSRGGEHSEDNLVPACYRCNATKYTKTLVEYLATGSRRSKYAS